MTTNELPSPQVQPPVTEVGVLGWLRHNLFYSVTSSIVTIILGTIVVVVALLFVGWAINDARWGVVTSNMRLFLVGRYPQDEIWRVGIAAIILSVLLGLSAGTWKSGAIRSMTLMVAGIWVTLGVLVSISGLGIPATLLLIANGLLVVVLIPLARRWPVPSRWLLVGWGFSAAAMFILLAGLGESTFLLPVPTSIWGGLLLTILLAVVGILLSFPIGVALALGRRSNMVMVRILSTAYIEIVRSVPLITILFMADLLLPLFLPGGVGLDRVVRAMGGITIFSAAYVAENVRGGLQAVPSGQVEAAQSVGLRGYQINLYIVLPQALRITIPANVGLFISLLKDTTLVIFIGLLEILGIGRAVLSQPEWIGASFEVFVFVGAVFFVLSYTLSQASYRLEKELGVGER
jgi:general L-amino acid transport system permease protein